MRHQLTRLIAYTPEQVFALVGEVDHYPEFVPWITGMRTWNAREVAPGVTSLDAEAQVGFAFLKERFASLPSAPTGARQPPHRRPRKASFFSFTSVPFFS